MAKDRRLVVVRGEAARAVWKRIHRDALAPNAEAIARIVLGGDIAVVVHNARPEMLDMARDIGWDGEASVFRMSNVMRKRFARVLKNQGDRVAHDWLMRKSKCRVFLIIELANFLMNFDGCDWSVEPGSTDAERLN
jgi:hypothetical protein